MKKLLFLLMMIVAPLVAYAQPGNFYMPAAFGIDGTFTLNTPSSGYINRTIEATSSTSTFNIEWDSQYNEWFNTSINYNEIFTLTFNGDDGLNHPSTLNVAPTVGKFYIFNINGLAYSDRLGIIMETSAAPVSISSVAHSPEAPTSDDAVTVTVTASAAPSAEEKFYVRYTTDNWSSATNVLVSFTDVTGTATIPAGASAVAYYVFSTTVTSPTDNFDLYSIKKDDNSGSNYTYTPSTPAPDTAPTLLILADNVTDVSIYPTLTWETVTNATAYRIQVSTVTDFTTTVVDDTTAGLTYSFSTALAASTELYWRVRGQSTEGDGPFATYRTFTTGTGVFSVYFDKPDAWAAANLYYFKSTDGGDNNTWPGEAMATPAGSSPWYSFEIPESYDKIIFNSGTGDQSSNLDRSTSGYYTGDLTTNTWSETDPYILSTGPVLTSPTDAATDIAVNTTLTWDALANATAYIVVIDDSGDFASPLDSMVATSPFNPTGDLAINTTYYWKVRGNNYAGNSDWTYASFTTEGLADGLSITDGDWSSTSTWSNGVVPSNIDVTISHSIVLDQNATVSNITIDAGKTLNGSSNTLSILDNGIITNNGTFKYATSTVHFLGDGSVAGSSEINFNNLIIDGSDDNSDYGGTYIPNTSTIIGTLTIATGGYLASSNGGAGITTNAELPIYASGAGLAINGPFTVSSYASGWGDSGSKLPENVTLGSSGDVELTTLARSVSGLLTVVANTVTTGGNLTILSGGSIEVLSGTISGNVTFEHEITGTEGWRTLSAPVTSTTVGDLMSGLWSQGFTGASTTNGNANVRTYNGSAYVAPTNATDAIAAGTGYAARIFADDNYEGEVEGFPKTMSATGTVVSSDVVVALNQGLDVLTLVGNPYSSTIDADFLTSTNLYGTVYSYSNTDGDFISWNGSTGSLTDGLIAPFRSFFVANNSADASLLTIPTSARLTQNVSKEGSKPGLITFKSTMGDLKSSAYLSFTEAGSEGKDNFDALKLAPLDVKSYLSISTFNGQSYLDINNLPAELNSSLEIPLFVTANQPVNGNWIPLDGEVTLSWPQVSSIPESWNVELIDNLTGETINMLDQTDYNFTLIANPSKKAISKDLTPTMITSDGSARFTIKVGPMTTAAESEFGLPTEITLNQNYPNPFNPSTQISFSLPQAMHVTVKVYDMLGREVATLLNNTASAGMTTIQYTASNISSGMYYYRLQAGETSITKKMMLLK